MTGPEHYREAERLLDVADKSEHNVWCTAGETIAAAQVHATLALAAATAEPIAQDYRVRHPLTIPRAWSEAIS